MRPLISYGIVLDVWKFLDPLECVNRLVYLVDEFHGN